MQSKKNDSNIKKNEYYNEPVLYVISPGVTFLVGTDKWIKFTSLKS